MLWCRQGSALDEEAQARATSVYLVQRVIPMLPRLLCEQLCSLNPGQYPVSQSVDQSLISFYNLQSGVWSQ